jgi:hypothetical protein
MVYGNHKAIEYEYEIIKQKEPAIAARRFCFSKMSFPVHLLAMQLQFLCKVTLKEGVGVSKFNRPDMLALAEQIVTG